MPYSSIFFGLFVFYFCGRSRLSRFYRPSEKTGWASFWHRVGLSVCLSDFLPRIFQAEDEDVEKDLELGENDMDSSDMRKMISEELRSQRAEKDLFLSDLTEEALGADLEYIAGVVANQWRIDREDPKEDDFKLVSLSSKRVHVVQPRWQTEYRNSAGEKAKTAEVKVQPNQIKLRDAMAMSAAAVSLKAGKYTRSFQGIEGLQTLCGLSLGKSVPNEKLVLDECGASNLRTILFVSKMLSQQKCLFMPPHSCPLSELPHLCSFLTFVKCSGAKLENSR